MISNHPYPHETYEPVADTVRESLQDWGMLREGDNDLAELLLQRTWDWASIENYADLEALPVGAVIIEHQFKPDRGVGIKVTNENWQMVHGSKSRSFRVSKCRANAFALPAYVLFRGGLSD